MDSIQVTESKNALQQQQKQVRITDVEITDENVALNILVGFLELAHKKGAFSFEESAKIWECIKRFQSSQQPK
jgi:ABC-type proline/glycine betaine transport system substrate-binding protein